MIKKYPLPKGWKWARMGDVIKQAQPGFACGKRAGSEGFIQLRMNNISSNGHLDLSSVLRVPATKKQVEKYQLACGDVIFNNTNSAELVGKTTLFYEMDGIFLYSNHLTRLRPIQGVLDSVYLAFWLQLQWCLRLFERICNRWIGQAAVQREKLLNLEIPMPPFPEQKRSAARIQKLMQEVERAKTACEKQLEAAKALTSAYLREIFESEEARKWCKRKLGEIFDVKQGVAMSPRRRQGISSYPFLRTLNVLWGSINLSTLDKMDFTEDEVNKLSLKSGDLLICEGGEVGRAAVWRGELEVCIYQNHIHRLRGINKKLIPEFYMYWMYTAFKVFHLYSGQASDTTISNISSNRLKSFLIPEPPLKTQEHIVVKLKERMTYIDKLQTSIEKQFEAMNALSQLVLREAFEGQL